MRPAREVDLNFPTSVAFIGSKDDFKVLVLESGHGLPSRCNDKEPQPPIRISSFDSPVGRSRMSTLTATDSIGRDQ